MKYNNYKLEDFLADDYFIEWVLNPNRDLNLFWEKWIASNPHQKKNIILAKEIILGSQFQTTLPEDNEKQEVLQKILKGYSSDYSVKVKKPNFSFLLKIAASVLVFLTVGYAIWNNKQQQLINLEKEVLKPSYVVKTNPAGQKSTIMLPDGTKVHLNSESSISFPEQFDDLQRLVTLKGEAFFEVKEDVNKPFVVSNNAFKAKVLGTSFNINNYAVSLLTGKVEVTSQYDSNKSLILAPGQKAVHDEEKDNLYKSDFNYQQEMAWKDGVLFFENATYIDVVNKLEKWYGVKINTSEEFKADWSYTGYFENESLERVLERLAYLENFEFELKGQEVRIYSKN